MAIALVNSLGSTANYNAAAPTTLIHTVTNGAAVGQLIHVDIGSHRTGAISSVVDSAGNTYTISNNAVSGQNSNMVTAHTIVTSPLTGGVSTITVTWAAGVANRFVGASAWSGIDQVSPLDQVRKANANTAAWASGSSPAITTPNQLVIGAASWNTSVSATSTPAAGQTELSDAITSDLVAFTEAYKIVSATGVQALAGTWSAGTGLGTVALATYKADTSGNTTLGNTADDASVQTNSTDRKYVTQFTPVSSGTLADGVARLFLSVAATSTCHLVVYSDSAGSPSTLLAVSDDVTISNTTEVAQAFVFSGANQIAITSGTPYWVGIHFQDPGAANFTISRANTGINVVASNSDVWAGGTDSAFGAITQSNGPLNIYVNYIASSGNQTISPTGLGSGAALGAPTLTPGPVTISPSGIVSASALGAPTVLAIYALAVSSIVSTSAVGTPTLSPGTVTISPASIGPATALGSPSVGSLSTISPSSIVNSPSLGVPTLSPGTVTISPSSIVSTSAMGAPTVSPGALTISPPSIGSLLALGVPTVTNLTGPQTIHPASITSGGSSSPDYIFVKSRVGIKLADGWYDF